MTAIDAVFLGGAPDPQPRQYIGRMHVWDHDPGTTWSRGAIVLPGGSSIVWLAYSDGVHQNWRLFQPSTRVVATGYYLAGDLYLTGIRPATDAEWQDAIDTLAQLPARQPAAA